MGIDFGNLMKNIGSSFASNSKNADGSTNPYAGVGQSAMQGLFGMLAAKGQSDDQNALMAQQTQQNRDSNVSSLQQSIMGDTLTRDKMYSDRNPMGADQQYMQQQMLRDILLQKMMAPQGTPLVNSGAQAILDKIGYKPFTPQLRDGWQEGPSMFGKEMSLNALGQNSQVNSLLTGGRAPQTNYSAIYGDSPVTQRIGQETAAYNDYATGQRQQGPEKWLQDAIDQRNAATAPQQKSGGNFFGKMLKGVGGALSFIPGVGQIAAPIASFAGGMVNGDGFKKSALGAGMSAIPMGLGKLGGAIGGTAGSIMGKIANPLGIGGGSPMQMIGQQAVQGAQGALGKAIGGNSNFYSGQYQQPRGQMDLPSRPIPGMTQGGFTGMQLPKPVNPSYGAR